MMKKLSICCMLSLCCFLVMYPGCSQNAKPGHAEKTADTNIKGMTVSQFGSYVKKTYHMNSYPVVSVLADWAFEIYSNPDDDSAPVLVVSWVANDQGVPVVDRFGFTKKKLPPLDDEDAVGEFCQNLLYK